MPVPLMDEKANIPTPAQWKVAAPTLKAGLECQKPIDANDPAIKPLSTVKKNKVNFVIVPPQGFKVFGLFVQKIEPFMPSDEPFYTAFVAAPITLVEDATKHVDTVYPVKRVGEKSAR